jgi:predicted GNAT family acetyltransferase
VGHFLEHRSLARLLASSRENILATYAGLAESVAGARRVRESPWLQIEGPDDMGFSNFIAGWDLDSEVQTRRAAEEVAALCKERPCISVFTVAGDRPASIGMQLIEAGFELRHTLVEMAWLGEHVTAAEGVLVLAQGVEERRRIADFMTRQFFWRGSYDQRRRIAEATAKSPNQLYTLDAMDPPRAAIMLVPQEDSLGIYNLCVQEDLRGTGLGGRLVRLAQAMAARHGVPAVLQCEASLARWYQSFGFIRVGSVDAYRLPDPSWFPAI